MGEQLAQHDQAAHAVRDEDDGRVVEHLFELQAAVQAVGGFLDAQRPGWSMLEV